MKKLILVLAATFCLISAQAQTVAISFSNVSTTSLDVTLTPDNGVTSYTYMIGAENELEGWIPMMGSLENIINQWGLTETGTVTDNFNELIPNTNYVIYCLVNVSGEITLVTDTTRTLSRGDNGVSEIAIQLRDITANQVRTIFTPNASTASYKNAIIQKATFEEWGQDSVINYLKEDFYTFYEVYEWIWTSLESNTEYYAVAIGMNAAEEWGTLAKEAFSTESLGIDGADKAQIFAYPNPATDRVIVNNLPEGSLLELIDMTGRTLATTSENSISLNGLSSGNYLLRVSNGSYSKILKVIKK